METLKKPLSELLRPAILDDFVGQDHLVGAQGTIRRLIQSKSVNSMIFWGPPGVGKTTLARIIAKEVGANFIEISPATAGVKDVKLAVENAKKDFFGERQPTILFVDEIHRFNKAQQDYLLPHVESGTLVLIGATTENPSFEIVAPLLSRTKVYTFNPISKKEMESVFNKSLAYLKKEGMELVLGEGAEDYLLELSNGDVRNLLNSLDTLVRAGVRKDSLDVVKKVLQENFNRYDRQGEEHYNTISAYIKSMRASDTDAALYYLARMVNAGEDPLFIARRMVVFSSEDIGMANPEALVVANAVFKACDTIGYPECQINLAHGTVYMCTAKKNRSAYNAYFKALDDVKQKGNLNIPLEIRNAPTKLMKDLGYGKGYEAYPEKNVSYLPKELRGKKYYIPKTD